MATRERIKPEAGKVVDMSWDPITQIDFDNQQVLTCKSTSSMFRGYSVFMKGKDPRDAHFITSRICGICGDNHATCAVYAQNMAFGIQPPALAEWISANGWLGRPTRAYWPRRKRPRLRTPTCTATVLSPTSCVRSTHSVAP